MHDDPDDRGTVKFVSQRRRTARKDHKCDQCSGAIEKGTRYVYVFWVDEDGKTGSHRTHLCCPV